MDLFAYALLATCFLIVVWVIYTDAFEGTRRRRKPNIRIAPRPSTPVLDSAAIVQSLKKPKQRTAKETKQ